MAESQKIIGEKKNKTFLNKHVFFPPYPSDPFTILDLASKSH